VIVGHLRRKLVRVSVTTNPTAEWIAGQVTEAFPWNEAPRRLTRDRDRSFGPPYPHRISSDGNPRSPRRTPLAVAEGLRQATHRLNSSGMPRSYGGGRGGGLAPRPESLRLVLQSGPHSSILEQRRAAFPTQPNGRRHRVNPHPWRTPSSICSRIEFSARTAVLSSCVLRLPRSVPLRTGISTQAKPCTRFSMSKDHRPRKELQAPVQRARIDRAGPTHSVSCSSPRSTDKYVVEINSDRQRARGGSTSRNPPSPARPGRR